MAENELKSSDRFPEGIWWRWNLHHEAFPSTCHRTQLWLTLFWKPFFPALFPCDSYICEQQASPPFTLNFPRQPPVEMYWANNRVRVASAHSNVTNVPVTLWRKVTLQEMQVHLTFTQWPSHPTVPFTAAFSSGQECKFIQCWSLQQMLEHQSGFGALILKTNTQSQTQIQHLSLNCLTKAFLTTNPSLNCNKLSKECRIDTSFLHSSSPVLPYNNCHHIAENRGQSLLTEQSMQKHYRENVCSITLGTVTNQKNQAWQNRSCLNSHRVWKLSCH